MARAKSAKTIVFAKSTKSADNSALRKRMLNNKLSHPSYQSKRKPSTLDPLP